MSPVWVQELEPSSDALWHGSEELGEKWSSRNLKRHAYELTSVAGDGFTHCGAKLALSDYFE